jgi:hypothetical protein
MYRSQMHWTGLFRKIEFTNSANVAFTFAFGPYTLRNLKVRTSLLRQDDHHYLLPNLIRLHFTCEHLSCNWHFQLLIATQTISKSTIPLKQIEQK